MLVGNSGDICKYVRRGYTSDTSLEKDSNMILFIVSCFSMYQDVLEKKVSDFVIYIFSHFLQV